MAYLFALIRLPWEVYLTLYVQLVIFVSKFSYNPRAVTQMFAACDIALTQFLVIYNIPQLDREFAFLGRAGAGGLMAVLMGMNTLILCNRYGDAFEPKLASMPVAKRWLLNVAAAAWVIFAFVVGYRGIR